MKTLYPVLLVLAIGVGGIMWSMSGMGFVIGQDNPVDTTADDRVNDSANELKDAQDESYKTSNQGSDSFVGSIISGGQQVMGLVSSALLLPLELQRLGFPRWMALPLGLAGQAIAFIGFIQFITGRVYE